MAWRSSSRSWRADSAFSVIPPGSAPTHEGPRVGAHCADVGLHPSRALRRGPRTQRALGHGQPDLLARPVPGVDEVGRAAAGLLARLEGRVVAQVGGDVDVGAAGPHRLEQVVAGAAEHGDAAHHGVRRAGDPDAARGRGQPGRQPLDEGAQRQRRRRGRRPGPAAGPRRRSSGHGVGEPARPARGPRTRPRAATSALVWAHVERDVADDEVGDAGALGAGRGDAVHAAQQQRVVGEQQVGAERRGPPR